jgi:UDP:flavonoid glycosyltransferase YjiC (YdhE family)
LKDHGVEDASPFYYVQALSPFLNLYCEPPEFLDAEDRAVFEPVEFFGTLPWSTGDPNDFADRRSSSRPKIYAAFGTGVFRYFEAAAVAALSAISETLADGDVNLLISLGGYGLDPSIRRRLTRGNVTVADYVDQWSTLRETEIFVTHHGVNSTHESIHCVRDLVSFAISRMHTPMPGSGVAFPVSDSPLGALSSRPCYVPQ